MPAVLYGHGTETRHLTLPGHDTMLALKTPNVLLRLEGLKNGSEIALPKAVQRNPIKGFLEHVDLILVRRGEKVTVEVPIQLSGEIAPGDGLLNQLLVQIPVEADATNIPQRIDVDIEGLEIGQAVHASDLTLPAGRHPAGRAGHARPARDRAADGRGARGKRRRPRGRPRRWPRPRTPETGGRRGAGRLTGERWIVAGLGNPGPEYAGNRHNVGHMVTALLAERAGARFKAHRSGNDVAEGRLAGVPVTLAWPRSYMNLSGQPVAALTAFYKVPPDRLVVIHDELDIPFGALRLKLGGGDKVTTGSARSPRRSARRTTTGSGSASAGRRAGWTRPSTCCVTSPWPSARTCPSSSTAPPTPPRR